jgi:hypothetical protein
MNIGSRVLGGNTIKEVPRDNLPTAAMYRYNLLDSFLDGFLDIFLNGFLDDFLGGFLGVFLVNLYADLLVKWEV